MTINQFWSSFIDIPKIRNDDTNVAFYVNLLDVLVLDFNKQGTYSLKKEPKSIEEITKNRKAKM